MSVPQSGQALGDRLGGRGESSPARRPSAMKTTRSAQAAADGSCVTITSVRPPLVDGVAQQREHLAAGARVQRAGRLVGEHDLRLGDERARDRDALLLAARQLRGPVARPVAEADAARARRATAGAARRRPASRDGSATFCSAVSAPSRLNDWKTKPMLLAAQAGERLLARGRRARGRRGARGPPVGRSSPAANCSSVDLPEPDGPMTAVNVPRRERQRDAVERAHGAVAAPEDAHDVVELDDAAARGRLRSVCSVFCDVDGHGSPMTSLGCAPTVPAQDGRVRGGAAETDVGLSLPRPVRVGSPAMAAVTRRAALVGARAASRPWRSASRCSALTPGADRLPAGGRAVPVLAVVVGWGFVGARRARGVAPARERARARALAAFGLAVAAERARASPTGRWLVPRLAASPTRSRSRSSSTCCWRSRPGGWTPCARGRAALSPCVARRQLLFDARSAIRTARLPAQRPARRAPGSHSRCRPQRSCSLLAARVRRRRERAGASGRAFAPLAARRGGPASGSPRSRSPRRRSTCATASRRRHSSSSSPPSPRCRSRSSPGSCAAASSARPRSGGCSSG